MASQAFLFTAYAIALNGSALPGKLPRRVPSIGIVTAALIYVGIFAALRATGWIHRTFKDRGLSEGDLGLPLLITPPRIRLFGLAAPVLLPGVFLAAWAYLLFA